ncbi:MAG TPA: hypothetical protein VFW75_11650, partial [Acetobacteraceae bacterium]|nr:hypothetical protein [Acetobacteraceae bacterium]
PLLGGGEGRGEVGARATTPGEFGRACRSGPVPLGRLATARCDGELARWMGDIDNARAIDATAGRFPAGVGTGVASPRCGHHTASV